MEQKEGGQTSSRWVWHRSPVKPEGQVQEKLGASGEAGLGELGGVGSRVWQLPPFLQSWESQQGSGNWQVSPRNPGAHLGWRDASGRWPLFRLSLLPSLFFLIPHPAFALPPLSPAPTPMMHTHWQVPCPRDSLRQVPPLAQGCREPPHRISGEETGRRKGSQGPVIALSPLRVLLRGQ